jgi:hypothetical protein
MHLSTRVGIASALFAACWTAPSLRAQDRPFAYAPGSYRYAVTTTVDRSQDQPAGRPPFAFEVVTKQWITLDLAERGRDTLAMTITVDSVSVGSSLTAPPPNTDKLRGAKLTGTVSRTGHPYAFRPPGNAEPETAALYTAFRKFLLPLPAQAIAARSHWADTTADTVSKEGLNVTTRTVTTSTVTGDTTIAGEPAWRIERRSRIEGKGTGTEAGRPLRLRNDGTISGTHYVSRRGVYLRSESTQRSELMLSVSESDVSSPIVQTIKSTVELLPGRP